MCGIVGYYNVGNLKERIGDGFSPIQHRGEEGAGAYATALDGSEEFHHRELALAEDLCNAREFLGWNSERARIAIIHVRFGTNGSLAFVRNVQPFVLQTRWGRMGVAHNGDTLNTGELRSQCEEVLQSDSDSEFYLHRISRIEAGNVFDAIAQTLAKTKGTFSLLLMGPGWLVAARDPWGNRPLSVGRLDEGWVVASESAALDVLRAKGVREVLPGEMLIFTEGHMQSRRFARAECLCQCSFDGRVYLCRPDSVVFGQTIALYREAVGVHMAGVVPEYADEVIVPVPDSGILYAYGFAKARGKAYTPALVRTHHEGRTYIIPGQGRRERGIRRKLNPIRALIKGKTAVLVDDSIVEALTSRKVVHMIRENGATRVVFVSCSPPVTGECPYGTRINDPFASGKTVEEVRRQIDADELYYLEQRAFEELIGDSQNYCFACFNGDYPRLETIC